MSLFNRHHSWYNTATIQADVDEVLDKISSERIAKEHNKRVEEELANPEDFKKNERYRDYHEIDIEIDPDDYDLMYQDDEELDDFPEDAIVEYLVNRGYTVLKKYAFPVDLSKTSTYINDLEPWKFKDVMCDILGLSHLADKETILKELSNKIK